MGYPTGLEPSLADVEMCTAVTHNVGFDVDGGLIDFRRTLYKTRVDVGSEEGRWVDEGRGGEHCRTSRGWQRVGGKSTDKE